LYDFLFFSLFLVTLGLFSAFLFIITFFGHKRVRVLFKFKLSKPNYHKELKSLHLLERFSSL
jgi:hypothetical protein